MLCPEAPLSASTNTSTVYQRSLFVKAGFWLLYTRYLHNEVVMSPGKAIPLEPAGPRLGLATATRDMPFRKVSKCEKRTLQSGGDTRQEVSYGTWSYPSHI